MGQEAGTVPQRVMLASVCRKSSVWKRWRSAPLTMSSGSPVDFFRDVEDLEASCAEAYERGSGGEFRLV